MAQPGQGEGPGSEVLPSAPGAALLFAGPQLRALLLSWCPTSCPCPGICPQPLRPGATAHGRAGEALVPPLQWEEAILGGHPWHRAPHLGAGAACVRLGLRLLPKSGRGLLEDGHGGSQQLIGCLQPRRSLPGGTPSRRFSVPCLSPSLLPAWARGVGWARGRVPDFSLLPSGSARPRRARRCTTRWLCLARRPRRPARFIFQSGSRQVPLLIPRGLCEALKRAGVRGEPAWGCWWPPARRPPAVAAVIAPISVCASRGSGRAS